MADRRGRARCSGSTPFGWRIASAVVGTLMVLVMVRLARRVTGSTLLGGVAGLLLCFDGLQLVLSRLALLDIFLAFFLLCAVVLPGRRPRLGPRCGWPGWCRRATARRRRLGPGRRAAVAALAARGRGDVRSGARHASGTPSTRWPASGSWSWCGTPGPGASIGVRRPLLRSAWSTPSRPSATSWSSRSSSTCDLDRLAAARRRLRAALPTTSTAPTGAATSSTTPTASSPSCSRRCARCGTTTTTSTSSTPQFLETPRTPTSPTAGLADPEPPGRRPGRPRHQARPAGLHGRRRTAPACAR